MTPHRPAYWHILQWLIVVAAYTYLIYRLITFDDYASLGQHFATASPVQYLCLLLAIALFPLNVFLEAWKWWYLVRTAVSSLTLREAIRQTYYGFVGAFFTPARVGDYPARVLQMHDKQQWLAALTLGLIGSMLLTTVIVLVGVGVGIGYEVAHLDTIYSYFIDHWGSIVVFLVVGLLIILFLYKSQQEQVLHVRQALHTLRPSTLLAAMGMSALRYMVFCLQWYLILFFCGISLSWTQAITCISLYYLLVTLTPNIPVADVAIKGSWAIIVFSAVESNVAAITIATALIWMINTICPMIVGSIKNRSSR